MKQLQAYFSGRVQGVGFRYVAAELAQDLNLSGYVKNLPGGRVELVAEGSTNDISQLLDQLKTHFKENIKKVDLNWSNASGEFSDFEIGD